MFVLAVPGSGESYSLERALGRNILIFKNFKVLNTK
jgi:hypothetical protein